MCPTRLAYSRYTWSFAKAADMKADSVRIRAAMLVRPRNFDAIGLAGYAITARQTM